jgi:hypothetical protein
LSNLQKRNWIGHIFRLRRAIARFNGLMFSNLFSWQHSLPRSHSTPENSP